MDRETHLFSLKEPVPSGTITFPFSAPHLCERIRSQHPSGNIRTTLKSGLQQSVEELVRCHAESLSRLGIANEAALIVSTGSGKARAYVGSQDFYDDGASRQAA